MSATTSILDGVVRYLRDTRGGEWVPGTRLVSCVLYDAEGHPLAQVPWGPEGWRLLDRAVDRGLIEKRMNPLQTPTGSLIPVRPPYHGASTMAYGRRVKARAEYRVAAGTDAHAPGCRFAAPQPGFTVARRPDPACPRCQARLERGGWGVA